MELDVEDVLLSTVGSVLGKFALFLVAVWIGCTLAAAGLVMGMMVDQGTWRISGGWWMWLSPLLLCSSWALLNIPFLIFYLVRFIRADENSYVTWGVVIAVESLAVILGWSRYFVHGVLPFIVAIAAWLLLLSSAEMGIWLVRRKLMKKWALEMELLREANAERRAEQVVVERERMRQEET